MFFCIECGKNLDENRFHRKVKSRCKDCSKKYSNVNYVKSFFTKKWLTTHFDREHRNESNFIVLEKPIINNVDNNKNNRTLLVGLSFSGKKHTWC